MTVRKLQRLRMPRSDAEQRAAISGTVWQPSPTALNRSRSIPARKAAECWKAVMVWKTSSGDGAGAEWVAVPSDMSWIVHPGVQIVLTELPAALERSAVPSDGFTGVA